ncbi:hypothetical protein GCM10011579_070950 [Streptomyces albiflavescens]|uniref:Secreted protein n=1 Tax=Streptomyces albiflavescens TaxID=1623582 RepID=A0A918D8S6_9ACTN|nr:hypothetical protein GCM10011579_070950 [Streptomyces albiflavescens]
MTGALAVAFAAVLLGAPSAMAGGPTSVLVVSPESAETTALYYSDKEYGQLMSLLGEPGSGTREEPPGQGSAGGHQLNVTWLAHDVSPWRVDRVYPDSPRSKDVWIHTTTELPSMNGYWHKAEDPAQVRALFKKLGVMGKPSPEGGGGIFPAPRQMPEDSGTASAPAEEARTTTAADATTGDGTDWWWAIPGAAAGAVLTLVLRPLVAGVPGARPLGRRERETEPRQELRDV